MKTVRKISLLLLLLFLAAFYGKDELSLGQATLSHARARPLTRPEGITAALKSISYLRGVGGVAFDKVALPVAGLYVTSMHLQYSPFREDGRRFSVTINNEEAIADIYDWELIPIARYANSSNNACFTLFGSLEDEAREQKVVNAGGRVLNYHPQLSNTLLGLRLFQLDVLIADPRVNIYLPKNSNGRYVLGAGERSPDILANRVAYNKFEQVFKSSNESYRSYLICDANRDIRFGIDNHSLFITGQPFYHFWQYNTDLSAFRKNMALKVYNECRNQLGSGASQADNVIKLQAWLLQQIRSECDKLESGSQVYESLLQQLVKLKREKGNDSCLRQMVSELTELRINNSPQQVVYMETLSKTFSAQPKLLGNINPVVWNAGIKTMRYAALFRYCKTHFPTQWEAFLYQLHNVSVSPEVSTPSIMSFN